MRLEQAKTIMNEKKNGTENKEEILAQNVSEAELDSVNGGIFSERDYAKDGCAATVEYGSDCWGTDGGCKVVNIQYDHPPVKQKCDVCGKQTVYKHDLGINVFNYTCRNCGARYIQNAGMPWKLLHM